MELPEPKIGSPPRKRRWFQYSLRTLLVVMVLACIGLSSLAVKMQKDRPVLLTTGDDVARYRGHQYRIWVFDEKSHAVGGFSEALLRPRESVRLEPVAGVGMDVQLEGPVRQSISDGTRIVSQYDAVRYVLKHRGGGEEGAASIIWPSLRVHRGIARGYDAVVFSLPVGPKAAESLAAKLPAEFRGARVEIEGVLLACLPEHATLFSEEFLSALYQIIGPTRQSSRWQELMEDPDLRIRAALVLALAGDRDATEVLCQEDRPETLALLPPSARVLERLVSILAQDKPLPCIPFAGCAQPPDRRCYLVPALLRTYPRADLLPYAPKLLRRAEGCDESWAKDLREYFGGRTTVGRP